MIPLPSTIEECAGLIIKLKPNATYTIQGGTHPVNMKDVWGFDTEYLFTLSSRNTEAEGYSLQDRIRLLVKDPEGIYKSKVHVLSYVTPFKVMQEIFQVVKPFI